MRAPQDPPALNVTVLNGTVHRPPQWRTLPSGENVTTIDVKTRPGARSEIVRVSWVNAPTSAMDLQEGAEVVVAGRVRVYWSGRRSETDVLAESIVRAKSIKQVRKSLATSMAILQEASP
jgi:hypothetical protein